MMTNHVIAVLGPTDDYLPTSAPPDSLRVAFGAPGHPGSIGRNFERRLAEREIVLPETAIDLYRATATAYAADVRLPRVEAFDRWTRDIVLHLPVLSWDGWAEAGVKFERLLSFLTGDHWRVEPRVSHGVPIPPARPRRPEPVNERDVVALFSGGLDSFVGALDLLEAGERPLLVGHHGAGQGATKKAQDRAINALNEREAEPPPFVQVWLAAPTGGRRASEMTTRGRSIIFLGLGAAIAEALGTRLVVPENGVISLNVPLTPARSGSFSTRTTHPYLVQLFDDFLRTLGLGVRLDLPYRFKTKGEMLRECRDQTTLGNAVRDTTSCAHPAVGRYEGRPNAHCGYCVPCLIRRASIASWGADPTEYVRPDLSALTGDRATDVRAVRLALQRFSWRAPALADVLSNGPIPGSTAERAEYLDVFRRGLAELEYLLGEADAVSR